MSNIYLSHSGGKPAIGSQFYELMCERLRQARRTRGMTQEALSKASGLSKEQIRGIERNKTTPSGKEILLLCHHLDITPNWAYYGTDNPSHVKHIQSNLVVPEGDIDNSDQLIRMSLFYSVLTEDERRALDVVLTSMLRGSYRTDAEIDGIMQVAKMLSVAFSNNPFISNVVSKMASDPELIKKIEDALKDQASAENP